MNPIVLDDHLTIHFELGGKGLDHAPLRILFVPQSQLAHGLEQRAKGIFT